uniref:Uncharacterized protein n=1 Tax=Candidatus Kentrum sp. LPFa TaxID=2126335 RepID=A0A450X2V3_9GAMM|nr:MAG: hypothetical protein BECKLPF1236A_GA0070988_103862 [Candidatus Kentron sp. LPFa]VFK35589.1 MAG: hypothetical protein BECKLPF1236C_GA0070990_103962 [Candidatus Kentron sp. LPFa]
MTQLTAVYMEQNYPEKFPPDLAIPSAISTVQGIVVNLKSKRDTYQPEWFKRCLTNITIDVREVVHLLRDGWINHAFRLIDDLYKLGDAIDAEQKKRRSEAPWPNPVDRIENDLEILYRKIAFAKRTNGARHSL